MAIKESKVWDGKGLPPVGMHCKIVNPDGALMYGQGESGEVVAHVEDTAVIRMSYGLGCFEARCLRPSRSEADKKRDAAVAAMRNFATNYNNSTVIHAINQVYDAIAAGKVPGVRIE